MPEFNKMYVLLPLLYLSRSIDAEDPDTLVKLRIAYGVVQSICLVITAYVYIQAQYVQSNPTIVYVPAPVLPFTDPNAKKRYTQVAFGAHVLSTARTLLISTVFGMLVTLGLHYYRGVTTGLAIQAVMGPFNLVENPLVKALFFANLSIPALRPQDKVFEEKMLAELSPEKDEIIDEQGQIIERSAAAAAVAAAASESSHAHGAASTPVLAAAAGATAGATGKRFEELLLDTWDQGAKADLTEMMAALTKRNCNFQTKEASWTPLMILCGLVGAEGTGPAIATVVETLDANLTLCDKDGWNAFHWTAFHGSIEAAQEFQRLAKSSSSLSSTMSHLVTVKDKEGKTPIDTARAEKNDTVLRIFQEMEKMKKTK